MSFAAYVIDIYYIQNKKGKVKVEFMQLLAILEFIVFQLTQKSKSLSRIKYFHFIIYWCHILPRVTLGQVS